MNNTLWALAWHPTGYGVTYRAFIIAEDTQEANYFWNKYKKANEDAGYTWERARNGCCGYATFHVADEREKDNFKALFPRRRKAGVYLCDRERDSGETDHVYD